MEITMIALIVGLFAASAFLPRIDRQPWQGGFILVTDAKQAIRIIYRIWAHWRMERVNAEESKLTQHFEVFQGDAPHSELRKMQ